MLPIPVYSMTDILKLKFVFLKMILYIIPIWTEPLHGDLQKLELLFEKNIRKNIIFDYKKHIYLMVCMFHLFISFLLYSVFLVLLV